MEMTHAKKMATPLFPLSMTDIRNNKRSLSSSLRSRPRRILTVGDGNFSYSLALVKQYKDREDDTSIELIATSYDSYEELISKYPESKRICAQLRKLGATIFHRIDATNIRESLVATGAMPILQFDAVVFNHPHCGEENIQRHQSLLSHFYASALEVLDSLKVEDDQCGILVTLAEGQPERWQAVQRAVRVGLILYRQIDDVDNDEQFGLMYERKRHQNGKSFHHVTLHGEKMKQRSTLFIFRRQMIDKDAVPAEILLHREASSVLCKNTTTTSCKRKAEKDVRLEFACTTCEKRFKSTQGLRTHVHMVHELKVGGEFNKVLLLCKFCDRTFKKEDARNQHQLAKHGKDPLIKPDWFDMPQRNIDSTIKSSAASSLADKTRTSVTTTAAAIAAMEPQRCEICDFCFTTSEDFDAHWQKLHPQAPDKRMCFNCSREFNDERALRQHQNFCNNNENERN